MTKTEHTTVSFGSRKACVQFADALLKSEGNDSTLTMTIKRSRSGASFVFAVTLPCVVTSR